MPSLRLVISVASHSTSWQTATWRLDMKHLTRSEMKPPKQNGRRLAPQPLKQNIKVNTHALTDNQRKSLPHGFAESAQLVQAHARCAFKRQRQGVLLL